MRVKQTLAKQAVVDVSGGDNAVIVAHEYLFGDDVVTRFRVIVVKTSASMCRFDGQDGVPTWIGTHCLTEIRHGDELQLVLDKLSKAGHAFRIVKVIESDLSKFGI